MIMNKLLINTNKIFKMQHNNTNKKWKKYDNKWLKFQKVMKLK